MDFRYTRPPPPPQQQPPSDPQQQPPLPPPQQPWHSGQFQYHSPQNWPPQHADHHLHPPPPYAAAAPPPPQEWNNASWGHQGWDYSAQNKNEDDWAARARAWAASKTVTDDQQQQQQQQQQQPHSVPASRPEEINYQGQYSQNLDPPYPEYQQNSHPPANYQQYPSFPPPPRPPANQLQEPSYNSGYASDGQFSYPARDGNLPNSAAAYPHQDNGSISSSGYPQEVPSSYSSVAGNELTDVFDLAREACLKNCFHRNYIPILSSFSQNVNISILVQLFNLLLHYTPFNFVSDELINVEQHKL